MYKKVFIAVLLVGGVLYLYQSAGKKGDGDNRQRFPIASRDLKNIPGDRANYVFYEHISSPHINNLRLPYGEARAVVLAERYRNIARAVEKRYGLPKNILLAMAMVEAYGKYLLGNSSDDGGFGNIHMQPVTAKTFGLHVFDDCNELICPEHHRQLEVLIEEYSGNPRVLLSLDDRLHPLLNFDAAGRMLAHAIQVSDGKDDVRKALVIYSGREEYYKKVAYFMALLSDENYLQEVNRKFNKRNKKLTINGEHADFFRYLEVFWEQNYNYGLREYEKLPWLQIKHADHGEFFDTYVKPEIKKLH